MSTCVLWLSARYSSHEIKNHENKFRGPFEEVMKIASPENYRLYGMHFSDLIGHRAGHLAIPRKWTDYFSGYVVRDETSQLHALVSCEIP